MSRPPKRLKQTRSNSAHEDRKLWEQLAKSIKPIKTRKKHVPITGEPALKRTQSAKIPNQDNQQAKPAPSKTGSNTGEPSPNKDHQTRFTKPQRVPQLSDFDKKSRRRLGAGRTRIDARIDLHGMHQNEAYNALRGFLFTAQANGMRWVLVITGKGTSQRLNEEQALWLGETSQGRGILRRSLPLWLSEPELRSVVVSHTTAAPHHGGEGARYVRLRSKRRIT